MDNNILEKIILNNTVETWLVAFLVFVLALVVLKIFKHFIIGQLQKLSTKTKTDLDDMLIATIDKIHRPFYLLMAIFIASRFVAIADRVDKVIFYLFLIVVAYYIVKFLENLVGYGFHKIIVKKQEQGEGADILLLLQTIAKIVLWVGAVILLLSNLGYNVTSLIAGLGIGGIAVALALQSILGDLFSSFAIYLDRPFKVGDFIAVGDDMGAVKKIGIKTTRLQSLQGEELVIANSQLTNSRINNFGLMEERRVVIKLGVTYDTPLEKLKKIPADIEAIIKGEDDVKFDRVHFQAFGDFSLNFEIVFYILSADYVRYMDIQQNINFKILEKFNKEKIEIAFPTQTIHLNKSHT